MTDQELFRTIDKIGKHVILKIALSNYVHYVSMFRRVGMCYCLRQAFDDLKLNDLVANPRIYFVDIFPEFCYERFIEYFNLENGSMEPGGYWCDIDDTEKRIQYLNYLIEKYQNVEKMIDITNGTH